MHIERCELNFVKEHVQNAVDIVFDYIIAEVKDKKTDFELTR